MSRESSCKLAANLTLPLKVGLGKTGGRDPPQLVTPLCDGAGSPGAGTGSLGEEVNIPMRGLACVGASDPT